MLRIKKISGVLQILEHLWTGKISGVLLIKMNAEYKKNIWSTPDFKKCIEEKNIWCTPDHASGVNILPSRYKKVSLIYWSEGSACAVIGGAYFMVFLGFL